MSESLMFAVLGALTACLFGTVLASFLWRRAVKVTKRTIFQDENFTSLEDVASLKADLRRVQSELSSKARNAATKTTEITVLERAKAEAESNITSASTALATALQEREEAQALLDAKTADLIQSNERVQFLETSIRTLATSATALLPSPPPPQETSPKPDETGEAEDSTAPDTAPDTQTDQPAIDVTRSLEERIEALKQGQTTH